MIVSTKLVADGKYLRLVDVLMNVIADISLILKLFSYTIKYDCTTFTSHANVFNENTVRTEGIKITLYFIMSSISLVK